MALETGTYISDLVAANPVGSDPKSTMDDHLRLIKGALKATFPAIAGAVTVSHADLNTVTARGLIAGQVWTGTHDFTGAAAIRVPAPTQIADAVNKAYADTLAMNAALPAQAGNAGKFVTTNGANAGWATPTADPAGNSGKGLGTSGAGNRWEAFGMKLAPAGGGVLTDANCFYSFTSSAAYTLPDFTGSPMFGLASLSNSAAVPATVQSSDGWTLTPGLAAGVLKILAPTSTATAHGTWGSIVQTPPVAATMAAAAAPTIIGTVRLSTDILVIVYATATATYAVALNTTTNAFGSPVSLGASSNTAVIYADSATNFVVGFGMVICGSVSGVTITLGAAVAFTYSDNGILQLTQGLYASNYTNGQCEIFTTSGTLVSRGANTTIGTLSYCRPIRVSNNSFLMAGMDTISSPATARFIVVTVSGSTPTGATPVDAPTTIVYAEIPRFLRSLGAGGPFIVCYRDNTIQSTGDYYGVTISGTIPTVGAVLARANLLPIYTNPPTYQYIPAYDASLVSAVYNASTVLVGNTTGITAIAIAGTTLSAGSVFPATNGKVATDAATGANFYAIGTMTDKITVTGTVIASSQQVAIVPQIIASDTLNNKAASYAAIWYAWTLPAMSVAATANKWLGISGSNINLYGPIS